MNNMMVKLLGATSLMLGIVGLVAGCASEDNRCGFGGCGPGPDAPAPSTSASSQASDPVPSTPSGGKQASDVNPENCPGPYHGATDDGRCVWSCSLGTHPDPAGGIECVCKDGLTEVGSDNFGRRVCE